MKILKFNQDGTVLAELTANEHALIVKAQTAPIKRKVKQMSPKLGEMIVELQSAKDFNDQFIETFYGRPKKPRVIKGRKK